MIPVALFTTFGPVKFVKILFSLPHLLWKTKLSFPVTIFGVKYVSASSMALAIAVLRSQPKEYDSESEGIAESIQNCCKLLTTVEMSQGDTNKNVLAEFPSYLRYCVTNILTNGIDKTFFPFTFVSVRFISTEHKVEKVLQLLWKFFS